jgi:hypothetical protein
MLPGLLAEVRRTYGVMPPEAIREIERIGEGAFAGDFSDAQRGPAQEMSGVREALFLDKLTGRLASLTAKKKSEARNGKAALAGERGQVERLLEAVDEPRHGAFNPAIAVDVG